MNTGWSSTRCRSNGDGGDRWKPCHLSWHALPAAPVAIARRDLCPVTATMNQATKTNSVDRLPCSYFYRSRHWIGKPPWVVSVLVVTINQGRLLMVHIFSCYQTRINPRHKMHKIRARSYYELFTSLGGSVETGYRTVAEQPSSSKLDLSGYYC